MVPCKTPYIQYVDSKANKFNPFLMINPININYKVLDLALYYKISPKVPS